MTKKEYINNIKKIIKYAKKYNKNANFVLIAPWLSNPDDKNSKLNEAEKNKLLNEYANSLNFYCIENNYLYINPNPYIHNIIKNNFSNYILDQIHPNENDGIELYSEAVLHNSK